MSPVRSQTLVGENHAAALILGDLGLYRFHRASVVQLVRRSRRSALQTAGSRCLPCVNTLVLVLLIELIFVPCKIKENKLNNPSWLLNLSELSYCVDHIFRRIF